MSRPLQIILVLLFALLATAALVRSISEDGTVVAPQASGSWVATAFPVAQTGSRTVPAQPL